MNAGRPTAKYRNAPGVKRFGMMMSRDLFDKLTVVAYQKGTTKVDIVESLLNDYLDEQLRSHPEWQPRSSDATAAITLPEPVLS